MLFAALLAAGCAEEAEPGVVLARVGEETLTVAELRDMVPEEVLRRAGRDGLIEYANQWIRNELLYRAAVDMGYRRDPRVRERLGQMERDVILDTYLQDELDMSPFISDEEVEAYHQSNQDAFRRSADEARFVGLWVADRAMAEHVRQALREGRTIEDAAADTSVAVTDMELGERFYQRDELEDGIGRVVFGSSPGTVGEIVQSEGQFAVVQIVDRQEAGTVRALWEVREDIEARLAADLREAKLQTLLGRLLDGADVSLDVDDALRALSPIGRRP
jgi:hypothetical protein